MAATWRWGCGRWQHWRHNLPWQSSGSQVWNKARGKRSKVHRGFVRDRVSFHAVCVAKSNCWEAIHEDDDPNDNAREVLGALVNLKTVTLLPHVNTNPSGSRCSSDRCRKIVWQTFRSLWTTTSVGLLYCPNVSGRHPEGGRMMPAIGTNARGTITSPSPTVLGHQGGNMTWRPSTDIFGTWLTIRHAIAPVRIHTGHSL